MNKEISLIAFYLPQFHPIPENEVWWGKGFTEWSNVARALPLFRGHYQPRIPADLGFCDLRVPEVRESQTEMARAHGIDVFCYWHYWFGGGKRLLERPFNEVLRSGKPDFPFCLAWANETWTGHWGGEPEKILMEQTYPGEEDYRKHFYDILPALRDPRYFRVEGKPLFYVYRPRNLPEPERFISLWRELARREGLNDIFFVAGGWYDGFFNSETFNLKKLGFDAMNAVTPAIWGKHPRMARMKNRLRARLGRFANRVDYLSAVERMLDGIQECVPNIATILTGWDTTPRSDMDAWVMTGYTPETFRIHIEKVMSRVRKDSEPYKIIFVKSWNEWAEGNYLEPDMRYGHAFLEALRDCK